MSARRSFLLFALLTLCALAGAGTARIGRAAVDTSAPQLVAFDFTPKTVNVTGGAQTVTLTAHITDAPSGLLTATTRFKSPSGNQVSLTVTFADFNLTSGTATDGFYQNAIDIPAASEPGTWTIESFFLRDNATNAVTLTTAQVAALTFPTALTVTSSAPDAAPPQLVAFDFNPKTVNVSVAAQTVTLTAHITDSPSGFSSATTRFKSPSGNQVSIRAEFGDFNRTSGTATDGFYQTAIDIPAFSEPGTWAIESFFLQDNVTNAATLTTAQVAALTFPTTLTVTSSTPDASAPQLVAFDFTPKTVNVSAAAQSVTLTAHITDGPAGFSSATTRFKSPSGNQVSLAADFGDFNRTSGTAADGFYQTSIDIPAFSESGTWAIESFFLQDSATNSVTLTTAQVAALTFPTELIVNSPTPPSPTSLIAKINASGASATMKLRLITYLNSAKAYLALGSPTMKSAACQQLLLFKQAVDVAARTDPGVTSQAALWKADADTIRAGIPCGTLKVT